MKECKICKENKALSECYKGCAKCKICYREAKREYNKKWRQENREAYREACKKWRQGNREYQKKRRTIDPLYKLSGNIRNLIYHSIRNQGYNKTSKTHNILGCSFEQLQQHLEISCLENYGVLPSDMDPIGLHIDHIIPASSATTEQELLALNHFTNLQYLTEEDNLTKGNSTTFKQSTL